MLKLGETWAQRLRRIERSYSWRLALHPNEIKRLIKQAAILAQSNTTLPESFIMLFIAWEAMQRRVLRVGLAARSMTKHDSDKWLGNARLASKSGFQESFMTLYGADPSQVAGIGHLMRELSRVNSLRHSYIHGRSRTSPDQFRNASAVLIDLLAADWEEALKQLLDNQKLSTRQTDPLKRISASRKSA